MIEVFGGLGTIGNKSQIRLYAYNPMRRPVPTR